MNNGNPIGIIQRPLEPKNENNHNHQRTKERIPNGILQRKEQNIHLLFALKKTQMSVVGYRVIPNEGKSIQVYTWEEAISVAEFLRQCVERQGIPTRLEALTEDYCIRNGSGVYARYDPPECQIVIMAVLRGHARL